MQSRFAHYAPGDAEAYGACDFIDEAAKQLHEETGRNIFTRISYEEENEAILVEGDSNHMKGAVRDVIGRAVELKMAADGLKKYLVSMEVNGRVDVAVYAKDIKSSFQEAIRTFWCADLSQMDVVGSCPVHAESAVGGEEADYNAPVYGSF